MTLTIKELLTFQAGAPIPCACGRITAVQNQVKGDDHGGWTVQDIMIEDPTGSIPVKIGNHPEIKPDQVGQVLYFVAHKKEKGGLSGVKIDTDTFIEGGQEKQFAFLGVARSGQILSEEEFSKLFDRPGLSAPSAPMPIALPVRTPTPPAEPEPVPTPETKAKPPGLMQVVELRYEKVVNTGNYCSERLGITIALESGTKARDALEAARTFVSKNLPAEAAPVKGRPVG